MTPAGPLDWEALPGKRRHGTRNARGTRDPAPLRLRVKDKPFFTKLLKLPGDSGPQNKKLSGDRQDPPLGSTETLRDPYFWGAKTFFGGIKHFEE